MKHGNSRELFERAKQRIPGGVNSPVRAFGSVGGDPLFIARGEGAIIVDVDGNEYVDFVGSWGPLILGHRHPDVRAAIDRALDEGWTFGASTPGEIRLAEEVCERVPSVEVVRMVNSGTEATLSALRLARGATGRAKLIKFAGCYHGHHDALLVAAGSGLATLGTPSSPGVTESTTRDTLVCRFNDMDSVRAAFDKHGDDIACVIVEPVAGNAGVIAPQPGFLEGLREVCSARGALLILDEVMTGFRLARGGAQELYDVAPDLTTMGKVIGGGMPVGAYGGRGELMRHIAPDGKVYQAGTLSGNPVAMAAGLATLEHLDADAYKRLDAMGARLEARIAPTLEKYPDDLRFARVGSMFTLFFNGKDVVDFDVAGASDTERFGTYFRQMLERGFYLPPSQFEANFISLAHTNAHIDQLGDAINIVAGGVLS